MPVPVGDRDCAWLADRVELGDPERDALCVILEVIFCVLDRLRLAVGEDVSVVL